MTTFWIVSLIILLALQFTVLRRGAPYVPTRHKQLQQALHLLNLKPGQTLIDLGSGDGAMLLAAARRGIYTVGYEINPILVLVSRYRTRKYGKAVKVIWGNFWKKQWPEADAVFVFLTGNYMEKLDQQMKIRFQRKIKLVTYGFALNNKKPLKKLGALFLYKYS
jgi:hypothetical protein